MTLSRLLPAFLLAAAGSVLADDWPAWRGPRANGVSNDRALPLADGKLYVANLEGQTFVLAASPTFKQLARNDLNETTYAAPAASNGALFLRTHRRLWCLAADK